ncbi:MAG: NAD-dependent epimerase/dehydratase family protein [bacterium]|nr:NAD-dependent epimerase/dehydratase family protein [bacterium]
MKALVTGGGGFIGRWIVRKLIERGDQVRVLGRRTYPELQKIGVETVQGNICCSKIVEDACRGVDCVFHVAALTGIWGPWEEFYQTNVIGTRTIIAGCQKQRVPRLVYTSSPSVVHDQSDQINLDETAPYPQEYLCPYPETKAMAERMVLLANGREGLSTVALRPHLVWGPEDTNLIPRLLERARQGKLIRVGDGRNKVDLTYVENVAQAHLLAADRLADPSSGVAGEVFFISQGEPVLLWPWIDQFLQNLGLPTVKKSIPLAVAKKIGWAIEKYYHTFHLSGEPAMTRFLASQLGTSHYFNIRKARERLNYIPEVSMEEGLRRSVAFYSKNK